MASRNPDLTWRIEGQKLKRRSLIANFRMATLYTPKTFEMNHLFSPYKRKTIRSSMPPYGLGKAGKLVAATAKRETVRSRMTAKHGEECNFILDNTLLL
jgi:hypothetical protein